MPNLLHWTKEADDGKQKNQAPSFRSDREEHDFWGHHSVEEFAGELEELDVVIQPPRTEQIALRLSKEDLEALRVLAKQRGVGHTTLARNIVEQWLARCRRKNTTALPQRLSHA